MKSALKKEKAVVPFNLQWSQQQAIELCVLVESICPKYGYHVGLTGGLLYKQGVRSDCDIVLYRIRSEGNPSFMGLWAELELNGFTDMESFGFVTKCKYKGKLLDIFYPEAQEGEYEHLCPMCGGEVDEDTKVCLECKETVF